ncbi:hypothetical protein D3C75_1138680 [compost metagenome]
MGLIITGGLAVIEILGHLHNVGVGRIFRGVDQEVRLPVGSVLDGQLRQRCLVRGG